MGKKIEDMFLKATKSLDRKDLEMDALRQSCRELLKGNFDSASLEHLTCGTRKM